MEDAVVGNDLGGVAGHEQESEIRSPGRYFFTEVAAAHVRHDHVGEEQINLARILIGKAERVIRPGRGKNRVTEIFQEQGAEIKQ